jgi:hypothetical protein
MRATLLTCSVALLSLASTGDAGPLREARINKIINDVQVVDPGNGSRAAQLQQVISEGLGVKTGIKSRSELLFQDQTLTRLGPESFFSFNAGTRDMNLREGTMLLHVPKGAGGAKIRTAAVTAAITGTTIMMEHRAGKHLKVLVLEGSLRLSVNGRFGDSLLLTPGKMVIMPPNARRIPDPVSVDIQKVVKTSSLVQLGDAEDGGLPSMPLIEQEIATQSRDRNEQRLVDTNLVILGGGTEVTLASDQVLATLSRKDPATRQQLPNGSTPGGGSGNGGSSPDPIPGNSPAPTATPNPTPGGSGDDDDDDGTNIAPPGVFPIATPPPVIPGSWVVGGPQPYDFPNPNAPAPGGTGASQHTPPATISSPSPYVIGISTTINTGGGSSMPTARLSNIVSSGTVYGGRAIDGSASQFLFGSGNSDDGQFNIDARFGVHYGAPISAAGVAVLKFAKMQLTGAPIVQTSGGRTDLALVSRDGITTGGLGGTWNLGSLRSLTLAAQAGAITLDNRINFTAPNEFDFLHIYARSGGVTLGGSYNLGDGRLFVDSAKTLQLASTGSLTARHVVLNGEESLQIDGRITADLAQLWSRDDVDIAGAITATSTYVKSKDLELRSGGSIAADNIVLDLRGSFKSGAAGTFIRGRDVVVTANGSVSLNTVSTGRTRFDLANIERLRVSAKEIKVLNHVTMPNGAIGILRAGSSGIDAEGFDLMNFEHITSRDEIEARNIDTRFLVTRDDAVELSGNLQVINALLGGDLKVAGAIQRRPGAAGDQLHMITAKKFEVLGGLQFAGANVGPQRATPGAGGHLQLHATGSDVVFGSGSSAIGGANFDGGSAAAAAGVVQGGDGGTLQVGSDAMPASGRIVVDRAISATTGENSAGADFGGRGGTVAMTARDHIEVKNTMKVSESTGSRASRQGGNIILDSRKTSGTAITVTSSAQLLALLSNAAPGPGGTIKLTSAGGEVKVNGTARADRGLVEITNNGSGGVITLANATLHGDVVKAQTLGANGQLNIGGGTISADTLLDLYAAGSNGTVRFTDNVTLSGNGVKNIAGHTVRIESGKVVTVNGLAPANVFTNNAQFTGSGGNGATTGTFGGQGAVTQPFSAAPGR